MEQEQKKEFTGVWIPKHIIEDDNLSMTDKIIYAEIACFEVCFKSNERLGERYGLKDRTISGVISKLKKKGYIVELGFDGRKRRLSSLYDKPTASQTGRKLLGRAAKKCKAVMQKIATIDNNAENKEENNSIYTLCGKQVSATSKIVVYVNTDKNRLSHSRENPIIEADISVRVLDEMLTNTMDELYGQINPSSETLKNNPGQMDALLDMFTNPKIGIDDTHRLLRALIMLKEDINRGWEHGVKYTEELNTPQRLRNRVTALKRYISELENNEEYQNWRVDTYPEHYKQASDGEYEVMFG
ncbi:MAG: helix-turn-helix domain-containing protein [Leadbetterella sp.]|nr:helix-turn-helix domain-containing protein [Leadbetterella sp.]